MVNKKLAEDFVNNNNSIFEDFTTETLETTPNETVESYSQKDSQGLEDAYKRDVSRPDVLSHTHTLDEGVRGHRHQSQDSIVVCQSV